MTSKSKSGIIRGKRVGEPMRGRLARDRPAQRDAAPKIRKNLLNRSQVREDGCVDDDVRGAVSRMVKGPSIRGDSGIESRRSKVKGDRGNVQNERLKIPMYSKKSFPT
jgi:hypothetical protein